MFVPPCAVTCVRIAPSRTGLASTISSVLNEGLKYFMTYGVAIRSLRQTNACCCFVAAEIDAKSLMKRERY